jgi:DNA-binding HxlR family transcriptional regulator/peroxiredoxin
MLRSAPRHDNSCAIAQGAEVIGDWWNLLIIREIAGGNCRFDQLVHELEISRKILTGRLKHLVAHNVIHRVPYQTGPVRYEYRLTESGHSFLPVLIAMQDWADRWLFGDGSLRADDEPGSSATVRVHDLVGRKVPGPLLLPGPAADAGHRDVLADGKVTVVFTYPGTGLASTPEFRATPVPGAAQCTLENRLFRDAAPRFFAANVALHGVSTQRPDEQAAFARAEGLPFPLLSDMDLRLTTALRLPTFRLGQVLRLKRLLLVVDAQRTVRDVLFPVADVRAAVSWAYEAAVSAGAS